MLSYIQFYVHGLGQSGSQRGSRLAELKVHLSLLPTSALAVGGGKRREERGNGGGREGGGGGGREKRMRRATALRGRREHTCTSVMVAVVGSCKVIHLPP